MNGLEFVAKKAEKVQDLIKRAEKPDIIFINQILRNSQKLK